RLWWPHIDYPQHVDEIRTGLSWNGTPGGVSWFDEAEAGWTHEAGYVPSTNIYRVASSRPDCPVTVEQCDFAVPGQPLFVRWYRLTNTDKQTRSLTFYHFGSFRIMESELYATTEFRGEHDALLHFRHQYAFAVGSDAVCSGYQAGQCAWHAAQTGELNGNEIDMVPDGAMTWRLVDVAPGATVELPIYIAAGHSRGEALEALALAKSRSPKMWFDDTVRYWQTYLQSTPSCPGGNDAVRELYERSLLAMKLMA